MNGGFASLELARIAIGGVARRKIAMPFMLGIRQPSDGPVFIELKDAISRIKGSTGFIFEEDAWTTATRGRSHSGRTMNFL